MKLFIYLIVIFLLLCLPKQIFCDDTFDIATSDTVRYYKIELTNKMEFLVNILQSDSSSIVVKFVKDSKNLKIAKDRIKSIERIESENMHGDVYWFPNPYASEYNFSPSAILPDKGSFLYKNSMVILNSFELGLMEYMSVGGAVLLLPFSEFPAYYISTKVGRKVSDYMYVGLGYAFSTSEAREFQYLGLPHALVTIGTKNHNLTFGTGVVLENLDLSQERFYMLSGMARFSSSSSLVADNWIIMDGLGTYYVLSCGLRIFGEGLSFDIGAVDFINASSDHSPFPYIKFTINF